MNRRRRYRAAALHVVADLAHQPDAAQVERLADRYHRFAVDLMRDAERNPAHAAKIRAVALALADLALDLGG